MPLHSQQIDIIAANTNTEEPLVQQLKAVDKAVDALLEECLCLAPRRTQLADEEDNTDAVLPIHNTDKRTEIGDPLCDDFACESDDDSIVKKILVDACQLDLLGVQCLVISDLKVMILSEPHILATSSQLIKPGQFFSAVAEVLAIGRTYYKLHDGGFVPPFSWKSELKRVVEVVNNYVPLGKELEFRVIQMIPLAQLNTMLQQIRLQPTGEYEQPAHAALRLIAGKTAHEACCPRAISEEAS